MLCIRSLVLLCAVVASGCTGATGIAPPTRDAAMVAGPPIRDISTAFDKALACLKGRIDPSIAFAVGAIVDHTGKEQLTEGGAGKFVTQGAGDIVQSALFKAGATVVNRRDPRVMTIEVQWNIRDPRRIVPSNYYVTGSINSLDFIPGGGFDVQVAGVGPRYRQHRMLVGLDLAMTDANTGRVVANVPLQKQIFASEAGVGVGRFFGETLVSLDIGGREREALHFALRQMLNLATFDLLTQVMSPRNYEDCRHQIDRAHGHVDHTGTAAAVAQLRENAPVAPAVVTETRQAPAESRAPSTARPIGPAAPDAQSPAAPPPPTDGFYWEDEQAGGAPTREEVSTILPN